jgi:hypothetical protein
MMQFKVASGGLVLGYITQPKKIIKAFGAWIAVATDTQARTPRIKQCHQ